MVGWFLDVNALLKEDRAGPPPRDPWVGDAELIWDQEWTNGVRTGLFADTPSEDP